MSRYNTLDVALAELKEISASEFEDYRQRVQFRKTILLHLCEPVCVEFVGAQGEQAWRIDSLDGMRTYHFIPKDAEVYA